MFKVRVDWKTIFEYLICFLLIYLSGSAAISITEDAIVFRILSLILCGVCGFYGLGLVKSVKSAVNAFYVLGACVFYLVLNGIIYSRTLLGLTLRMLWVLSFILVLMARKVDIICFLDRIYYIVLIISVISLVAFVIVNFKSGVPYVSVHDYFYRRYFGFFYVARTYLRDLPFTNKDIYRLQSFFWEPGVYAIYLVFAMYYFVFYKKEKRLLQMAILTVSLLLTFSTAGICIGIVLGAIFCIRDLQIDNRVKAICAVPLTFISAIGVYVVWTVKKVNHSHENGSYYLRRLDFFTGLKLIARKPFLGWGYKNYGIFEKVQGLGRGSSNGLITLGYTMGVVGLVIVLLPFILCVIKSEKQELLEELVFSIIFVLTNMTEPIILMPFMIFFVVYEYRKIRWIKIKRWQT